MWGVYTLREEDIIIFFFSRVRVTERAQGVEGKQEKRKKFVSFNKGSFLKNEFAMSSL